MKSFKVLRGLLKKGTRTRLKGLRQCIKCSHEASIDSTYPGGSYNGRWWVKTWHTDKHVHPFDDGITHFFTDEILWPSFKRYVLTTRKQAMRTKKAMGR